MNTDTENEVVQNGELQQEQPADNAKPNAPVVDQEDDDEDEGGSNGDDSGEQQRQKPKRPRWSDVNRANREALEARRREDELRERLRQFEQPAPPPKQEVSDAPPSLEDCDFDDAKWRQRTAEWHQSQVTKAVEQAERRRASEASDRERQAVFAAKEAEFIAAHPDYEGVAKAPHVPITQPMAEIMLENPATAPAIAYWFGQNVEEAARIAQMTPTAAARAIGAIEARLTASTAPAQPPVPPKPPVKPAPPVVPQLQAGAPAQKDWKQLSPEEHRARLREQQAQQRR